jgi:hypothetical protein
MEGRQVPDGGYERSISSSGEGYAHIRLVGDIGVVRLRESVLQSLVLPSLGLVRLGPHQTPSM